MTRARHQRADSELGTGNWACVDCLPKSYSIPSASAAFQSPKKREGGGSGERHESLFNIV